MKKYLLSILFIFSSLSQADDPFNYLQWYLSNDGTPIIVPQGDIDKKTYSALPGKDIGLRRSKLGININRKIKIAVIDSGVELDHKDLKGVIRENKQECLNQEKYLKCLNTESNKETCHNSFALLDSDENGYPRDCHGWNVAAPINEVTKLQGHPRVNDETGHGTHVTGIIAALQNNNIGIKGVANNVEIIPIKTTGSSEIPPKTTNPIDLFAQALKYAIANNVDIINMSFGWKFTQNSIAVRDQIRLAASKGIIMIAAAGNSGNKQTIYPCAFKEVICVGAHLPNDQIAPFSSVGNQVDLYAPGLHILSTYPLNRRSFRFVLQKGYEYMDGTSQAAPMVTGTIASLLSYGFTNQQAKDAILKYSRTGSHPSFPLYSFPLLDLEKITKKVSGQKVNFRMVEKISPFFYIQKDQYNYDLKIKNLSDSPVSVKLSLDYNNDALTIVLRGQDKINFNPNEIKSIPLKIDLNDSSTMQAEQQILLTVRDIKTNQAQVITTSFSFFDFAHTSHLSKKTYSLPRFPPNFLGNKFVGIRDLADNKSPNSEFAFFQSNGKGTLLSILRLNEGIYEIPRPIQVEEKDLILINASKLDLNLDGKLDYFLYLLKRDEVYNRILNKNEPKFTSYFLALDHSFNKIQNYPLPEKYLNENIILSGRMSFHPNSNESFLIPYWISFGSFEHSSLKTPWEDLKPKQIPQNNIYFFNDKKELSQHLKDKPESEPIHLLIQNTVSKYNKTAFLISKNKEGTYFLDQFNGKKVSTIKKINASGIDLENFRMIPVKGKQDIKVAFYNEGLPGEIITYFLNYNIKNNSINESTHVIETEEKIQQIINVLPQPNNNYFVLFKSETTLGIKNIRTSEISLNRNFFTRDNLVLNLFHNQQTLLLAQLTEKDRSDKFLNLKKGSNGDYFFSLLARKNFLPNNDCFFLSSDYGFWSHTDSVFYFCPTEKQILELIL
ncbi:S8 family serine peptidase [Bacteriovoracaceae bacterium]|nr:S8 family serine peptidase [Bacteriovoracaceae bacterium]